MPHVLIAGKLHDSGLAVMRAAAGFSFDYVEEISVASMEPYLPRAEALVLRTQPLTAATIARAPRLRMVSRHGVGYDSVDVDALDARGIPLTIVGDVNSVAVAEHAMMLLLAAVKRAVAGDRAVREGRWNWRNGMAASELNGKTLLIIGYGRIGRRLAKLADAFGMRVLAYDPFIPVQSWPAGPAEQTSDLAAALAAADAVSLNMLKAHRPILDRPALALMKPTAVVVNTARGGMIDEAALADALRTGRLAAAGLDVFSEEPPASDHPLYALDTVVLSPHVAGLSRESAERMAIASVDNVIAYFNGTLDAAFVVNRPRSTA